MVGRWNGAGALEQAEVEDALYAAALANGLVADDGQCQCWATIRSGLGARLQEPIDLDRHGWSYSPVWAALLISAQAPARGD
jgi:hypothetical protein